MQLLGGVKEPTLIALDILNWLVVALCNCLFLNLILPKPFVKFANGEISLLEFLIKQIHSGSECKVRLIL